MIITPNSNLQQECLTLYTGQNILCIQQWLELLLGQTSYHIASNAIIDQVILDYTDFKTLNSVKQYINYIYQQSIPLESLKKSSHPNSNSLATLFEHVEESLLKNQLIHPYAVHQKLVQLKSLINPLYDHVIAYGFNHASPSELKFIEHYCHEHKPMEICSAKHQVHTYHTINDEVDHAISWLKSNPNGAVINLNASYQTHISFSISQHYHPNFISIPAKQCPVIQHFIHVTQQTPMLSYDIIPHLKIRHCWPTGLSVPHDAQNHFPRHKFIKLDHHFTLLHMHHDPLQKITVDTFISYINTTLAFWKVDKIIASVSAHHQHMKRTMQALRTLSYLNQQKTYAQWHQIFTNIMQSGMLSHPDSPKILNGHDALQSRYERLWILGGTDDCFGHLPKMSWLPSSSIQKTNFKPILFHSSEITISHQVNDDNGEPNHFSLIDCDPTIHVPKHEPLTVSAKDDWKGPPLTEPLSGGISLIKDIAICRYKSLAQHRLKLFPKYTECLSVEPKDIGNAVHDVLEQLYKSIDSQHDLALFTRDKISYLIDQYWQQHHHHNKISDIIRQDIVQRIEDWIKVDQERQPFTILSIEEKRILKLGEHCFSIRIDRIDWVDGQAVLIDYKTGHANLNDVFSPDFSSPQMALYALTEEQPPTIAFAKIKAKSCQWQSINLNCEDSIEKHQSKKNTQALPYSELKAQWYKRAISLTQLYIQGDYLASPSHEQHCNQCAFIAFCRYYDQGAYHHESC